MNAIKLPGWREAHGDNNGTLYYRGLTATIYLDTDPIDPREDDPLGTMFCRHTRYALGDKNMPEKIKRAQSWEGMLDIIDDLYHPPIILPLYIMDHGLVGVSTKDYGDRWDSGQVGYVFATDKKIREYYDIKGEGPLAADILDDAKDILESEVREYDKFLNGDFFGFTVGYDSDDEIDGCWGIDDIELAKSMAEDAMRQVLENAPVPFRVGDFKYFKDEMPEPGKQLYIYNPENGALSTGELDDDPAEGYYPLLVHSLGGANVVTDLGKHYKWAYIDVPPAEQGQA